MIFSGITLVIGILILAAGVYFYAKEKHDTESRKIYGITIAAGIIVTVFAIIRLFLM